MALKPSPDQSKPHSTSIGIDEGRGGSGPPAMEAVYQRLG
jgi:hypothetical protein